ncbi:MAG: hypothetical protein GXN91_01335 [Epsilonproteobacteria bacterium]|nr:hypothetical protein [Campylobacterota bacterium]
MKRFIPLFIVLIFLGAGAYFILNTPSSSLQTSQSLFRLDEFDKQKSCARLPLFLYKNGINAPIIDLSQKHYKGIAFYFGPKYSRVLHKKSWERFDALGTYTIDNKGDIYLTPNPFISIKPTTFNLQKAIYKLDGKSAELSRWMVIEEVAPNPTNPYGLISIVYDCDSGYLIASSIDKSSYRGVGGRIYLIDRDKKEILQRVEGFDALTLNILKSRDKKYLIAGSARDGGVYLFRFKEDGKLDKNKIKLFELPTPELKVRKIKVIDKNTLKLEAIKFNYSLVAQSAKKHREEFIAKYDPKTGRWEVKRVE